MAKRNKNGASVIKKIKTVFGLFIVSALLISCVLIYPLFKPYQVEGDIKLLSISKGQTYSAFIDDLAEQQNIHFPLILKIYQKFIIADTLKAGVYEVEKGMRMHDVLKLISDANNAQMNRLVVIEGTTYKQLKKRLLADPMVSKTILHLPDAQILQKIDAQYTHPEGLFAPDTYFFAKGETDLNILKDLHQRQMNILDKAWNNRAQDLPYKNKYDALIMASIVEKETALESERNEVAGVFIRRLKIGMRLQTDPTVIYGMGDQYDGDIRRKDLRTPTAYNTYTISGLPPTPIALTSERSIVAAMHPDNSKSLYFVATGRGGHKFSNNLVDHNRAVQDYLKVLRERKQGN